jgi:uncharacterized membrane protein
MLRRASDELPMTQAFISDRLGTYRGRISAVDATRGAAMLLVCLSHFGVTYLGEEQRVHVELLLAVSMLATPSFLFISGMMLGLLYDRSRGQFTPMRVALIDRALFLLTIAHVAILGSLAFGATSAAALLQQTFVTDTIGLALLFGALIVDRMDARTRAALGLLVYLCSSVLEFTWQPYQATAREWKQLLVGANAAVPNSIFSLFPWFGIYLVGSAAGEQLSKWIREHRARRIQGAFAATGMLAVMLAVCLKLIEWLVVHHPHRHAPAVQSVLYFSTSPWQKYPPGPVYLLFFGGLGLCLMAVLFVLLTRSWFIPVARFLMLIGRCSLFVFVAQYYVYFALIRGLRPPPSPLWPMYFALSIVPLALGAWWWDRRDGNRYFTMGTRAAFHMAVSRRAAAGQLGEGAD